MRNNNILEKIHDGRNREVPPRVVVLGPEGIGKTTFATQAPDPLFICSEDGLFAFEEIPRFQPDNLTELCDFLIALNTEDEIPYKSIHIDTGDWLERLIHRHLCERDGKQDIEAYGYGKGYTLTEAELIRVLSYLDCIRIKHKIWLTILCHVQISKFDDPAGESWDRYSYKGNKKFGGILREWPEACLFAVYEVHKVKDRDARRDKVLGGDRIMHTEWGPGWDAKNRLSLPPVLPFPEDGGWQIFEDAVKANSPAALREKVRALLGTAEIPAAKKAATEKWAAELEKAAPAMLKTAIAKLQKLQPKATAA